MVNDTFHFARDLERVDAAHVQSYLLSSKGAVRTHASVPYASFHGYLVITTEIGDGQRITARRYKHR